MFLHQTLYLYIFLPVFMGLYVLIPSKKRPWIISAANILFLLSHGVIGAVVFAVSFILSYFSAIAIYNARLNEGKRGLRRALLTINAAVNAAVFIIFAHSSGADIFTSGLYSAAAVYGAAVMPLHAISYVADVYRGDCAAQTRISSLAAYISFFPSLCFGPVLKYKNFKETFKAPAISSDKMASGIRIYVFGLAEYVLVAEQLDSAKLTILSSDPSHIGGISLWMSALIFYTAFMVGVFGLVHMGQGTALMMGFPVKPPFRRRFLRASVYEQMYTFNMPLNSWYKDYVYNSLISGEAVGKNAAAAAAVLLAAAWYSFSPAWMASALIWAAALMAERKIGKKADRIPLPLRFISVRLTAAAAFSVAALSAIFAQTDIRTALSMLFSTAASENEFFIMLINTYAPLTVIGLIIISSLIPSFSRRINLIWFRAALPVIELLLIMLSTAFMISV